VKASEVVDLEHWFCCSTARALGRELQQGIDETINL